MPGTGHVMAFQKDMNQVLLDQEEKFLECYPNMVDMLTREDFQMSTDLGKFFKKSLQYNVPLGKKRRAMFMVFIYDYLKKGLTQTELQKARAVAWAIELACFLVADDIMDKSIIRRGQPCWCRVLPNPRHAFNDVFHLEGSVYRLLELFTKEEDYFLDLWFILREITYKTMVGQFFDVTYASPTEVDFTNFTRYTYMRIVKYKTSYYTFYLPAALGMTMAGVKDPEKFKLVEDLMLQMGEYFQIQDDYIDCYGDPAVCGKIGTDIQDNKCSWVIMTALEIASDEQKEVLEANYGRWEESCVSKVKAVFLELDIPGIYSRYEEETYAHLTSLIQAMGADMPRPVFQYFLHKLYKRRV